MAIKNTLVRERVLNKRNVTDCILFAGTQSCPLLKGYAISFLAVHSTEVLKSEHTQFAFASLMNCCLRLSCRWEMRMTTVTEFRKELGKRKRDVDGSKETLVARLEEAKRQKTD
jgi:hypothetical protein